MVAAPPLARGAAVAALCSCVVLAALLSEHGVAGADGRVVTIEGISPVEGSTSGGTRVTISGRGFAESTSPAGNIIYFGGSRCRPIPLHSTTNQIVCVTDPVPFPTYVAVSVLVDGTVSATCNIAAGCNFFFTTGATPTITRMRPEGGAEGTVLSIMGNMNPFSNSVNVGSSSPTNEVPVVSVKIANRGDEQSRPENEPLGPPGSRCDLVDTRSESLFGVSGAGLKCRTAGPRMAGRYNISLVNSGRGGAALITSTAVRPDVFTGIPYGYHHVAQISNVSPSKLSASGGSTITITGTGFTSDSSMLKVSVAGTPCTVTDSSATQITCTLATRAAPTTAAQSTALWQGGRGASVYVWYNKGFVTNFFGDTRVPDKPSFNMTELGWFETWYDTLQSVLTTTDFIMSRIRGVFYPPVTSNYTFATSIDDYAELYVAPITVDAASGAITLPWTGKPPTSKLIVKQAGWSPNYNWYARADQWAAKPMALTAGQPVLMDMYWSQGQGPGQAAVAAHIEASPVNRKDSPYGIDEVQTVTATVPSTSTEVIDITLRTTNLAGSTLRFAMQDAVSPPFPGDATVEQVQYALNSMLNPCDTNMPRGDPRLMDIDTFEPDTVAQDVWGIRNGYKPIVVADSTFCGGGALFHGISKSVKYEDPFNNAFMPWYLQRHPYMCFAYNIPPGSQVSFLILTNGTTNWVRLPLTYSDAEYAPIDMGGWRATDDGYWHHECLNVRDLLGNTLKSRAPLIVSRLIFYVGEQQPTSLVHPFWLDEFSISTEPRTVTRPALGSDPRRVRLVSVVRTPIAGGMTYRVTMEREECQDPNDAALPLLGVDRSALVGNATELIVKRVQSHSAPPRGQVRLQLDGTTATFGLAAQPADVAAAVTALKGAGPRLQVRQLAGSCGVSPRRWQLTYTHSPGRRQLPAASVIPDATGAKSTGATASTAVVTRGGLLAPISTDFIGQVSNLPTVQIWVNQSLAACTTRTSCAVTFVAPEPTAPVVSSIVGKAASGGTIQVVVHGQRLTSAVQVRVANQPCTHALHVNATTITCTSAPLPAGQHRIDVVNGAFGFIGSPASPVTTTIAPVLASVEPPAFPVGAAATLTLRGSGFPANSASAQVTLTCGPSAIACNVLTSNASVITCAFPGGNDAVATSCSINVAAIGAAASGVHGRLLASTGLSMALSTPPRPAIASVKPTSGLAAATQAIDIIGSGFAPVDPNAKPVATVGGQPCTVLSWNATRISCRLGPGAAGALPVAVTIDDREANTTANPITFTRILSITSVTPSTLRLAGGEQVTIQGHGFSATGVNVSANLVVMDPAVQAVGFFRAPTAPEVQTITIRGRYVEEVQLFRMLPPAAGTFSLTVPGFGTTPQLPVRTTLRAGLLEALQSLPGLATIRVSGPDFITSRTAPLLFGITFIGVPGNIPTIQVHSDQPANVASTMFSVAELLPGDAPVGTWRLNYGSAQTRPLSPVATDLDVETALAAVEPSGVSVSRADITVDANGKNGFTWSVTFTGQGLVFPTLVANVTALTGATVTVQAVSKAVAEPFGTFKLGFMGATTGPIPVNASSATIRDAVRGLSTVRADSVSVSSVSYQRGALLDQVYPTQWLVSFLPASPSAFTTLQVCTHPSYVDWRPDACPTSAADLYLAFNPWYYPPGLVPPADLDTDERRNRLLEDCAQEAVSLQFQPATCQAPLVPQTRPMCGVGSGIKPPCFVQLWDIVRVQLADGTLADFQRNDDYVATYSKIGYRFWQRLGATDAVKASLLTPDDRGMPSGSGITVRNVRLASASQLPLDEVTVVSDTEMRGLTPSLMPLGAPLTELLTRADQAPLAGLWTVDQVRASGKSFSGTGQALQSATITRMAAVKFGPSAAPTDSGQSLRFDGAGGLVVAPDTRLNTAPAFSAMVVTQWLAATAASTAAQSITVVRSVDLASSSGYAIGVSPSGKWAAWLGTGTAANASAVLDPDAASGLVFNSTAMGGGWQLVESTTTVQPGQWVQLVLRVSAGVARLAVDGVEQAVQKLTSFAPNTVQPFVIGGDGFVGGVDIVAIWGSFLSNSAVASYPTYGSVMRGAVSVSLGPQSIAACSTAACTFQSDRTSGARVDYVWPVQLVPGQDITLRGVALAGATAVKLNGSVICTVKSTSATSVVCTIDAAAGVGRYQVSVTDSTGVPALTKAVVDLLPQITAISPTTVGAGGGVLITITGKALSAAGAVGKVTFGGLPCTSVVATSTVQLQCTSPTLDNPPDAATVTVSVAGVPAVCAAASCAVAIDPKSATIKVAISSNATTGASTVDRIDGRGTLEFVGFGFGDGGLPTVTAGPNAFTVLRWNDTNVLTQAAVSPFGGVWPLQIAQGVRGLARTTGIQFQDKARALQNTGSASITVRATVSSIVIARPAGLAWGGGDEVTVTGSGFLPTGATISSHFAGVQIGRAPCIVRQLSNTAIVCSAPSVQSLAPAAGSAGLKAVTLKTANLQVTPSCSSITTWVDGSLSTGSTCAPSSGRRDGRLQIRANLGAPAFIGTVGLSYVSSRPAATLAVSVSLDGTTWTPVGGVSERSTVVSSDSFRLAPTYAQYVLYDLTYSVATAGYGIGEVLISTIQTAQDVEVSVGSQITTSATALCATAATCRVSYNTTVVPLVRSVTPASFNVGVETNLTLSGVFTPVPQCSSHSISVGGVVCTPFACSGSSISCTIAASAATVPGSVGISVSTTVSGVASRGWSVAGVTILPVATSLSQGSIGSIGGGFTVTVGAPAGAASVSGIAVCERPCSPLTAGASSVSCQAPSAIETYQPTDTNDLNIVLTVASPLDDAVEHRTSDPAAVTGSAGLAASGTIELRAPTLRVGHGNYLVGLRFSGVAIPAGATIQSAYLSFVPDMTSCGNQILITGEAAGNSAPFSSQRYDLSSRTRTTASVTWVSSSWAWRDVRQQSADVSAILQELVQRPDWRAQQAVTLLLSMAADKNAPCIAQSADNVDATKRPQLIVSFKTSSTTPAAVAAARPNRNCTVSVTGPATVASCTGTPASVTAAARLTARSSPAVDVMGKYAYPTSAGYTWVNAQTFCNARASRLCTLAELCPVPETAFYSPFRALNNFIAYQDSETSLNDWAYLLYGCQRFWNIQGNWYSSNVDSTYRNHVACCGRKVSGGPQLALDGHSQTWWETSVVNATGGATWTADVGVSSGMLLSGITLQWGQPAYATNFAVQVRVGSATGPWITVFSMAQGAGESIYVPLSPARTVWGVRVDMAKSQYTSTAIRSDGQTALYSIAEVQLQGCATPTIATAVAPSVQYRLDASPVVSAVQPSRGSTEGNTLITITGTGFGTAGQNTVTIGGVACAITAESTTSISCRTGRVGAANGGKKAIIVSVAGRGSNVPSSESTQFWYIDAWSSKSTWGGGAPPAGCGAWADDFTCRESVVIPKGQTVLLDVSPPRLYLLLIEGTLLVDDTRDLTLDASYILIRGGAFQAGLATAPRQHKLVITLYGNPLSTDLPTFGAKTLSCYACRLDLHGMPSVSWTMLDTTALPGSTTLKLVEPVAWSSGDKLVLATTDMEVEDTDADTHHNEILTVVSVSADGRTVTVQEPLKWPHIGEVRTYDGRQVELRAEVGRLTRNIVIQGDSDDIACPDPVIAEDGITRLSCNKFGAHVLLHSPGDESLVAHVSNVEFRNTGQAFRLGRYALHFHMIGSVRSSYAMNNSFHDSWNRAVAIHGVHHLRVMNNVAYRTMGHTFFIEDGVEMQNVVDGNLGIMSIPAFDLLNTDVTPAAFWVTNPNNYIRNNHAVGSKRYGFWYRAELSATGTSANTVAMNPINVPLLQFENNVAHSNGRYGLRIYDQYLPSSPAVFRKFAVWRNGMTGVPATIMGRVSFEDAFFAENGERHYDGRSVAASWGGDAEIRRCVMVGYLGVPHAQTRPDGSPYKAGRMETALILPWNNALQITNVSFVNFADPVARGCAHCGRGGSPERSDGAFETRFRGIRWVNSSLAALFWHPHQAVFRDMDGTFTRTGIPGSSIVGYHAHLPSDCTPSPHTIRGAVCTKSVFVRVHVIPETKFIGYSMALSRADVSPPFDVPFSDSKGGLPRGLVMTLPVGHRHTLQWVLKGQPNADIGSYTLTVPELPASAKMWFSTRFNTWAEADKFGRPLYWAELGGGQSWELTSNFGAGADIGLGTAVVPLPSAPDISWVFDAADPTGKVSGGVHTYLLNGCKSGTACTRTVPFQVYSCPKAGCWPPPPAPPPPPAEPTATLWSAATTWSGLLSDPRNPFAMVDLKSPGTVTQPQVWAATTPSAGDDVWIPSWKRIELDVSTPALGHVIVDGTLVFQDVKDLALTATKLQIRGGKVIIGSPQAPQQHLAEIVLIGDEKTPPTMVGKQGVVLGGKGLAVFGKLQAYGKPYARVWSKLSVTAEPGATRVYVNGGASDWPVGASIVLAPTNYDPHQTDVRVITAKSVAPNGNVTLTLDQPLTYRHFVGFEAAGSRNMTMAAAVGLLSRNVVIRGADASGYTPMQSSSYGCGVHVGVVTTELVYCSGSSMSSCQSGFVAQYSGQLDVSHVEFRGCGRAYGDPAVWLDHVPAANWTGCAVHTGYGRGIVIDGSSELKLTETVLYHTVGQAVHIKGEGAASRNVIDRFLAVRMFEYKTYNGQESETVVKELDSMFDDDGDSSTIQNCVAAGSERNGFSGKGADCQAAKPLNNEAYSSLFGYQVTPTASGACKSFMGFQAWKILNYGFYAETAISQMYVTGLRLSDCKVGVEILSFEPPSIDFVKEDKRVFIRDALVVGASKGNSACRPSPPSFSMCLQTVRCQNVNNFATGILSSAFSSAPNHAPKISEWRSSGAYAALGGQVVLDGVTFARFGSHCGVRDVAFAGNTMHPDGMHPHHMRRIEWVQVEEESKFSMPLADPSWLGLDDCVFLDCQGPRNFMVIDDDGTALGAARATVVSRSEYWNDGNRRNVLPPTLTTTADGKSLTLQQVAPAGWGMYRKGCTFSAAWNGFKCPASLPMGYLVVQNMDNDHEIRDVSPLTIVTDGGVRSEATANLVNGCQDHGWCASYTCLKRLMTFWVVMPLQMSHLMHFSGTNPQMLRYNLLDAGANDAVLLKVYYQSRNRLNVFVDDTFVEDLNMLNGESKARLVAKGSMLGNSAGGTKWVDVVPTLAFAHGSNTFDRTTQIFYLVLKGPRTVTVKTVPVVEMSAAVTVSPANFYKVQDAFIENLASVLGIPASSIKVVDVVADSRRLHELEGRWRSLASLRSMLRGRGRHVASGSQVVVEILPAAQIGFSGASVSIAETASFVEFTVTRSANLLSNVTVAYRISALDDVAKVHLGGLPAAQWTGKVSFRTPEITKTIRIPLRAATTANVKPAEIHVDLSNCTSCNIAASQFTVYVTNANLPPPAAPQMSGVATVDGLKVVWDKPVVAAGLSLGLPTQYEAAMEFHPDDVSTYAAGWVGMTVDATGLSATLSGLYGGTRLRTRVRVANSAGWSDWSAVSAFFSTAALCGDSRRSAHLGEQCDDSNTVSSDGCSSTCLVERGFSCVFDSTKTADKCTSGCGDGIQASNEPCDDGNSVNGDGCASTCTIEYGFVCTPAVGGSRCAVVCGDGLIAATEQCDDGNTAARDGCSATCTVETDFTCRTNVATFKSDCASCGNGRMEAWEVCDDAKADGGCLSDCSGVTAGWTCAGTSCWQGPAVPAGLSRTGAALSSRIMWSWTDVVGATAYAMQFAPAPAGVTEANYRWRFAAGTDNLITPLATVDGLNASSPYAARVRAKNANGWSPWSPASSVSMTAAPAVQDVMRGVAAKLATEVPKADLGVQVAGMSVVQPPAAPALPPAVQATKPLTEAEYAALSSSGNLTSTITSSEKPPTKETELADDGTSLALGSGAFSWALSEYRVDEDAESVVVNVKRLSGSFGTAAVQWNTVDGTAKAGKQYTASSGKLTFGAGITEQTVTIAIKGDVKWAPDVTFQLVLRDAEGGATIGQRPETMVVLVNNDAKSMVSWQDGDRLVSEGSDLTLTLVRTANVRFPMDVDISMSVQGTQVVTLSKPRVAFAAGETSQSVSVSVKSNADVEVVTGQIVLNITTTDMSAMVGAKYQIKVSIKDMTVAPSADVVVRASLQLHGMTAETFNAVDFSAAVHKTLEVPANKVKIYNVTNTYAHRRLAVTASGVVVDFGIAVESAAVGTSLGSSLNTALGNGGFLTSLRSTTAFASVSSLTVVAQPRVATAPAQPPVQPSTGGGGGTGTGNGNGSNNGDDSGSSGASTTLIIVVAACGAVVFIACVCALVISCWRPKPSVKPAGVAGGKSVQVSPAPVGIESNQFTHASPLHPSGLTPGEQAH